MFRHLPANARELFSDINNFLKNEAEIISDFKTRIATTVRELDHFQATPQISYNRVINKLSEADCVAFLADTSLFMEENY